LVPDDSSAISAVPFGQPLFRYLIELFGGIWINNGSCGPHNPYTLPVGSGIAKKNPQRSCLEFLRAWHISLKGSLQLN
jgi:hypothetical protein